MARNRTQTAIADPDVEVAVSEEGEETAGTPEATEGTPTTKEKAPKKGKLPEGYVTLVGLAKVIAERGLQTDKDGNVRTEVPPQMVYSYQRNASKNDPFPTEQVTDDAGIERQAVKLEDGVAWWERKNKRASDRKANAAAKAQKAADKAATSESNTDEAEASGDEAEAE